VVFVKSDKMKTLIIVCLLSSCLLRTTTTTATTGSEENIINKNNNNVIVAVVNETVTFDCDDHLGDHILWKKRVTQDVTSGLEHFSFANNKLVRCTEIYKMH
jgi:hypothetical protein